MNEQVVDCPYCAYSYPVSDDAEMTSLADHSRCIACHHDYLWNADDGDDTD